MASALRDGIGLFSAPRKPVTFGVFLMRWNDFVGQRHLDQDVAREKLALGVDLAAAAHIGDLFGRHQHLLEQFFKPALASIARGFISATFFSKFE